MLYSNVDIAGFGYELPSHVVSSEDLENRLADAYAALHLQPGQLEALTGIVERRFWDPGFKLSIGAIQAGRKALADAGIPAASMGMLIYGGVCRENLEPATACAVANGLGLGPSAELYDVIQCLPGACLTAWSRSPMPSIWARLRPAWWFLVNRPVRSWTPPLSAFCPRRTCRCSRRPSPPSPAAPAPLPLSCAVRA